MCGGASLGLLTGELDLIATYPAPVWVAGSTYVAGNPLADRTSEGPLDGLVKAFDEDVLVERLAQEARPSVLERALTDALIRNGRDEDKRDVVPMAAQMSLQIHPAHSRHADVDDRARCIVQMR